MATRSWINDAQWLRVQAVLAAQPRRGRPGADDRRFFEAVVWWRRTGVPFQRLSVNLSFGQFRQRDLHRKVADLLPLSHAAYVGAKLRAPSSMISPSGTPI